MRKYKLLIADDEYWTREKLRHIIEWDKYNIEFMEPAKNGEEVLERMAEITPDILISDINMPIVNGVELVEQVKEQYPSVITFIVSGYDDFNYVKSTMKAGAINYLLKPINRADLILAVSEAMDIINRRLAQEEVDQETRNQQLRVSSMMQDHEYSRLIDRDESGSLNNLSINLNLETAGYGFVLLKIHNMQIAMDAYNQDINQLSYEVKKRIKAALKEEIIVFNHATKSNEFIIISKEKEAHSHRAAIAYTKILEAVFQAPITVVLNDFSYSIESFHYAYTQAISLLMTRKYAGKSEIIFHDKRSREIQEQHRRKLLSEKVVNQLVIFLKAGNKTRVEEVVTRSLDLEGQPSVTYLDVKQMIRQINSVLMSNMQVDIMDPADIINIESLVDEVDKYVDRLDLKRLIACERDIIDSIMVDADAAKSDTMEGIVRQVKNYIDSHYFEELSLAVLSERFAAEPSYLSKSFKQFTKENLMVYIARKRMEQAVSYITENQLSLSEISFLVGYDDYTYFSRVFKKIVGVSPRDYKAKGGGPVE